MDIDVKGPCILLQKVWVKPFINRVGAQIGWGNPKNTIPPFPCGPSGNCGGQIWENGVQVDSFSKIKDGSDVYSVGFFKIEKGQ